MKIKLFALVFAFIFTRAEAQRVPADVIATKTGSLTVQPVQHASLVLEAGGKTLYSDPVGGAVAYKGLPTLDVLVITHTHGDHFDTATLSAIKTPATIIVVPQSVADLLPGWDKSRMIVLKNGDHTQAAGISIQAVAMYNLPSDPVVRHPKGLGNGYVLNLGGKNIYISGDTEGIPEMRALKNIDIAFVCMNLPYTMDIDQAADAVLAFAPKIVYPYHYRGQNGLSDIAAFKNLVDAGHKGIDVRLRNWYPKQ